MDICFCGKRAGHLCRPCKFFLCEEHKTVHDSVKNRIHSFEKQEIMLSSEEIDKFKNDVSIKMMHLKQCEHSIVIEAQRCIEKIKKMCTQALLNINEQTEKCVSILINIRERLSEEKLKEIESLLLTNIVTMIPTHGFIEIDKLCASFYLNKVITNENMYGTTLMCKEIAKIKLKNGHGLSFEGHTDWVSSTIISSDNKYFISCSYDNTVRVWDLKGIRQIAILQGHTDSVDAIALTSDN